jgi:hypothetical protein
MGLLISLVVFLVILGLVIWVVQLLPLPPLVGRLVAALVLIIALFYLLGYAPWLAGPVWHSHWR